MLSQSQLDYVQAIELVRQVDQRYPAGASAEQARIRRRYGGLCHDFPIMLRNSGLSQTVAFYRAKAANPSSGEAFKLLLTHVARILGEPDANALETRILGSSMQSYRQDSARVWDAWVYFKRLAVSILRVEPGTDDE